MELPLSQGRERPSWDDCWTDAGQGGGSLRGQRSRCVGAPKRQENLPATQRRRELQFSTELIEVITNKKL